MHEMNMRTIITMLLLSGLFYSCNKDATTSFSNFQTPIVTGFAFTDASGNHTGQIIGNPNTNLGGGPLGGPLLLVFPNPANKFVYATIGNYGSSNAEFWIVPALYDATPNYSNIDIGSNSLIVGSYAVMQITSSDKRIVLLDAGNLSSGYYRVYCRYGDNIYWDNLIIEKK